MINGFDNVIRNNTISFNDTRLSIYSGGSFYTRNRIVKNVIRGVSFRGAGQPGSTDWADANVIADQPVGIQIYNYPEKLYWNGCRRRIDGQRDWYRGTGNGQSGLDRTGRWQRQCDRRQQHRDPFTRRRFRGAGCRQFYRSPYQWPGNGQRSGNRVKRVFPGQTQINPTTGDIEYRFRFQTDAANAAYPLVIDFYLADGDTQQGEIFLGSEEYLESQTFEFHSGSLPIPESVPSSGFLIATATDADGNTSQFTIDPVELQMPDSLFQDRFEAP